MCLRFWVKVPSRPPRAVQSRRLRPEAETYEGCGSVVACAREYRFTRARIPSCGHELYCINLIVCTATVRYFLVRVGTCAVKLFYGLLLLFEFAERKNNGEAIYHVFMLVGKACVVLRCPAQRGLVEGRCGRVGSSRYI